MKGKAKNTNKSQLDKANAALVVLSKDVIAEDRRKAPVAEITVITYLRGEGKELSTAMKLLRYFKSRIEGRNQEIENILVSGQPQTYPR